MDNFSEFSSFSGFSELSGFSGFSINIGDYVDIAIKDGDIVRYYAIKMTCDKNVKNLKNLTIIEIVQFDDRSNTHLLINQDSIWRIMGADYAHTVSFPKNEIKYFERDFTQAIEGRMSIAEPNNNLMKGNFDNNLVRGNFIELKNGIIFHRLISGAFDFIDPNNITKPFLTIPVGILHKSNKIMSFNGGISKDIADEIFIYRQELHSIVKFNLNNLTFTKYDENPQYRDVFPLKHEKILCVLQDLSMYILDIVNNKRINFTSRTLHYEELTFRDYPEFYPLYNGDIILKGSMVNNSCDQLYRIDGNDCDMSKISGCDACINIISSLKDDKILLLNNNSDEIQIWTLHNDQITEKLTIIQVKFPPSIPIFPSIPPTPTPIVNRVIDSELLQNGDVLFIMKGRLVYLFNYTNKQVIELSTFESPVISFIKQLQNGNLLIDVGSRSVILEFPINQREIDRKAYDKAFINTESIIPDVKNLIRTYL